MLTPSNITGFDPQNNRNLWVSYITPKDRIYLRLEGKHGLGIPIRKRVPFYIFRSFLQPLSKFVHPKWVKLMSAPDGDFYEEPYNQDGLKNILMFGVIAQGDPSVDKIRKFFQDYVLNYKNFRGQSPYQKLQYYFGSWLSYPFWKRAKNFDLNHHIRLLSEFEDSPCTSQEELEMFLGEYISMPFGWKRPPWELLVVKNFVAEKNEEIQSLYQCANFRKDKKFVLLFRWHHALADGESVAQIFINIFGGETFSPLRRQPFFDEHNLWADLKFYSRGLLRLGYDTLKLWALENDRNIWRISDEIISGNYHLVTTHKLPYNVARTVSKKNRASVTTVLFASVAGGIRQYFIEAGQQRRIPKEMRVRVTVPIVKHAFNRLTNYCRSYTNITLPVGQKVQIERFAQVSKVVELLRKALVPSFVWFIRPIHAALPIWLSNFNIKDRRTTLAGWHFPGPKQELLLFGEYMVQDLLSYHPRLLTDAAIGLSIFSYNGAIRFSLCVDKTLFPHRESALKLARLIEMEFLSFQEMNHPSDNERER
ncbi:unnamed protein product [Allacma fusca]|uniref:O-acyltransferase WSD1 C-terminal domain-containing protein n=1 Tax=Allacma fusca TaxID=39272 RepID=A0A8J2JXQ2_9HEXA|nr:unnamed protein product [Allacma fusca]